MAVCPECRSRKGKRRCPALRQEICSTCCGEKRIVAIPCPSDCAYLARGSENDYVRTVEEYLKNQEPKLARRWLETLDRFPVILETLEGAAARAPRGADDRDLLAAIQAAHLTFDADAKGVIYEAHATSSTAEAMARDIVGSVRDLEVRLAAIHDETAGPTDPNERAARLLSSEDVSACLVAFEDRCAYHIRRSAESGSLIEQLRRVYHAAAREGAAPEAPRIVLG